MNKKTRCLTFFVLAIIAATGVLLVFVVYLNEIAFRYPNADGRQVVLDLFQSDDSASFAIVNVESSLALGGGSVLGEISINGDVLSFLRDNEFIDQFPGADQDAIQRLYALSISEKGVENIDFGEIQPDIVLVKRSDGRWATVYLQSLSLSEARGIVVVTVL